ncbi:hypothetical protein MUP79_07235 [Candidatus Bathyarchaeota archaeon]|nr:hypothetical protein [Candidatus Bathyarchaeota archaeon]
MKFKTVIQSRVPEKMPKRKFMVAMLMLLNIIIGDFVPFIFGFYYATTQSIVFFIMFLLLVIFNIEIDYEGEKIRLRIRRII